MNRQQRYRYEMFVRVRDFGAANEALFPRSSEGGQQFARVTAIVADIEEHLKQRDIARVDAQRVKTATRAKVRDYMRTIAHIARRANRTGSGGNRFKLPQRKSVNALVTRARVFADLLQTRGPEFARFGLSPASISEFTALVEQLEQAVAVRMNSRSARRQAQEGVEHALVDGFAIIQDLDALMETTLRNDPVHFAGWQGARRIEGVGTPYAVTLPAAPEAPAGAEQPDAPATPAVLPADAVVPITAEVRRAS
jgi:hypothetical protein